MPTECEKSHGRVQSVTEPINRMLTPPEAFGCVEEGVYRCSSLDPMNLQFIATLGLTIIISINPEKPSRPVRTFAQDNMIQLVHLGLRPWRSSNDNWMLMSRELIQDSMTYVLDRRKHPILLLDSTNAFVGVLRRLQHWKYSSVVAEYRAFSGGKSHYMTEIFLELIDMKCIDHDETVRRRKETEQADTGRIERRRSNEIVISLPPDEYLPEWFVRQFNLWKREKEALQSPP
ncbi:hypothetical protein TRVA0_020S01442 [Trichomonascus vanleenenianus]|uniref:uncharacterized protein n=1 Tax=Trichomonascus vanleenenianus TaxID=2268995 RepID=UPI003ECA5FBA